MTRSQFSGAFVIVEGSTDALFYEKFLDNNTCKLIVAENKTSALEIMKILESDNFSGVLAILDADYDRILGVKHTISNLILTDTHDVETLIVRSDGFNYFIKEFASKNKIGKINRNIRDELLNCCKLIGYLRLTSIKHDLNLKFNGLSLKSYLSKQAFELNRSQFIQHLINHSKAHSIKVDWLTDKCAEIEGVDHNIWDVCCGHDLVNIISISLQGLIGNHKGQQVLSEYLEKSLRLSFHKEHFQQTQIYQSLYEWQHSHSDFLLLRSA